MDIVLRSTAIYFALYAATRVMGKRELAEMSPFDLILLVIMGDLIQQGVTQNDRSVFGALIAVATITLWVVVFGWITYRSKRVRDIVQGLPVVVVRDGRPVEDLMAIERLTLEELQQQARALGIKDLREVRLAVLEPEGKFSFVLGTDRVIDQARRQESQSKPES
jgi:uncharacterized membrane protein YcaP (DUF421 family)